MRDGSCLKCVRLTCSWCCVCVCHPSATKIAQGHLAAQVSRVVTRGGERGEWVDACRITLPRSEVVFVCMTRVSWDSGVNQSLSHRNWNVVNKTAWYREPGVDSIPAVSATMSHLCISASMAATPEVDRENAACLFSG